MAREGHSTFRKRAHLRGALDLRQQLGARAVVLDELVRGLAVLELDVLVLAPRHRLVVVLVRAAGLARCLQQPRALWRADLARLREARLVQPRRVARAVAPPLQAAAQLVELGCGVLVRQLHLGPRLLWAA